MDKLLQKKKKKVTILCGLYESVLLLFKMYDKNFQKSTPMIHKLYYEQEDLFKQYLSYFVKPSVTTQHNDMTKDMTNESTTDFADESMYHSRDILN